MQRGENINYDEWIKLGPQHGEWLWICWSSALDNSLHRLNTFRCLALETDTEELGCFYSPCYTFYEKSAHTKGAEKSG